MGFNKQSAVILINTEFSPTLGTTGDSPYLQVIHTPVLSALSTYLEVDDAL